MRTTTKIDWLAMAGGIVAASIAITIMVWEKELLTLDTITMIGTVIIAILFGLLTDFTWHKSKTGAIGAGIVTIMATFLVILNSAGMQAEVAETKDMAAETVNAPVERTEAELERQRARLVKAETMAAWERAGRPDKRGKPQGKPGCGSACKGWQGDGRLAKAEIEALEAKLKELGPKAPSRTDSRLFASLGAAVFGLDKGFLQWLIENIEPIFAALTFELAAIVGLKRAFAGLAEPNRTKSETDQTCYPTPEQISDDWEDRTGGLNVPNGPEKPNGSPNGTARPHKVTKDAAIIDLTTARAMGRTFGSQDELCERWGQPKSTVSNWLDEFEAKGLCTRKVEGRRKVIA